MIVRPKKGLSINIMDWKFLINLNPKQKWECEVGSKQKYYLSRDNVTMSLSKEEFEKFFKVVE